MSFNDDLPTDLWIAAQMRTLAREGIPAVVRKRGAGASGSLLLKINRLDGTADLYDQVRIEDERVWLKTSQTGPLSEAEAEAILARQIDFDPDLWVVEIEDKQGRLWFSGRVVNPE